MPGSNEGKGAVNLPKTKIVNSIQNDVNIVNSNVTVVPGLHDAESSTAQRHDRIQTTLHHCVSIGNRLSRFLIGYLKKSIKSYWLKC